MGYGPGVAETSAKFEEERRSQAEQSTGAVLEMGGWGAPRERFSKEQKAAAAAVSVAKAEAKKATQVAAEEKARAQREAEYRHDVDVCELCDMRFLSAGGIAKHRLGGCGKRTSTIEKEKHQHERRSTRSHAS